MTHEMKLPNFFYQRIPSSIFYFFFKDIFYPDLLIVIIYGGTSLVYIYYLYL